MSENFNLKIDCTKLGEEDKEQEQDTQIREHEDSSAMKLG